MPPPPIRLLASLGAALLLAGAPLAAARAEPAVSHVGVGLQARFAELREDLLRPLAYRGPGLGLALGFDRRRGGTEHEAALALAADAVTTRFGQEAIGLGVSARYEQARRVAALGPAGRTTVDVGAALRGSLALQYHVDWDDAHAYWLTAYDLGPLARLRWDRPGGGRLSATVVLPLVALASRPPERRFNKQDELKSVGFLLGRPHRGLRFAAPPRYLAGALRLAYERPLGAALRGRVAYELDGRRHARPRAIELVSHLLLLEVRRAL